MANQLQSYQPCPACGRESKFIKEGVVNRCVNLQYVCTYCELEFTIATSNVAYKLATKLHQLEEGNGAS
ncbi:hypothetical protein LCGC14_1570320 [marine sediment metagenome]|uniref:Uncharacterized protein n=1 Tax=marine sediment metagenome TaxID=412755 RepID=A0A0F9IJZ6_9ZZZZ